MRDVLADERLLRHVEWANAVFLVLLTCGGWILFSPGIAFGVFLGGIISTLSFQVLKWQLRRAFQRPAQASNKGAVFFGYYLRFGATLYVIFTVIYYQWVDPIAFVVGLSSVVLSISLVGVREFVLMVVNKGER